MHWRWPGFAQGQFHRYPGAVGIQVFQLDLAIVFADDSITDAETEAGALAHGLGGVEGIQGPVYVGESRTTVLQFDDCPISAREGAQGNPLGLRFRFHRIDGVVYEIQQDLLELVLSDRNFGQIRPDIHNQFQAVRAQVVFA